MKKYLKKLPICYQDLVWLIWFNNHRHRYLNLRKTLLLLFEVEVVAENAAQLGQRTTFCRRRSRLA